MNSNIIEHAANEKIMEIMRSVELFIGIVVVASLVGFVCLSAL